MMERISLIILIKNYTSSAREAFELCRVFMFKSRSLNSISNQTHLSTPETISECVPLPWQLLPRLQSARMKWKCAESEWNEAYIACRRSDGKVVEEEVSRGKEAKSGMGGSVANRPMSAQLSVSC